MLNYSSLALTHFDMPRNVGELPIDDKQVIHLKAGLPENGSVIEFFVRLNEKNSTKYIEAIKFKAYGDVAVIACCSFITELVTAKPVSLIKESLIADIIQQLQLPEIKHHCPAQIVQLLKQLNER